MAFLNKIFSFSFFKKGKSVESELTQVQTPHDTPNISDTVDSQNTKVTQSEENSEESFFDKMRREEERKRKEWLEFLRSKRIRRKKELEDQLSALDEKLQYIQDKILAIKEERKEIKRNDTPNLTVVSAQTYTNEVHIFQHRAYEGIASMQKLLALRIEEERKKVAEAEKIAETTIKQVREALLQKDINQARLGLDILSQQTAFIENRELTETIKEVVFEITELGNLLIAEQREKEEKKRREEALEAKRRAEAIERKRQEEEAKRLQEEQEKRERARKYQEGLLAKEKEQQEELKRLKELSSTLKTDASEIINLLKNNSVKYLYHFTDESNIPLIKSRNGLYSWSYLLSHNWKIPCPGGNDRSRGFDRDKGLEDYVRLSFCTSHPMAHRIFQESGRKAKLVLLKIKLDVAVFESTLFSNINATDKNAIIGDDYDFINENIDFEATSLDWCWGSDPRHKKRQAEIMVKTYIPLKYIVNIDNPEIIEFNN